MAMLLHRILVFGPFFTLLTWWADNNAVYAYAPQIFNWSFTASIVICAVLLLRLALKKAPRIFSYALWGIVLLRLLCPVSLSSELSLLNALDVPEPVSGAVEYVPHDIVHSARPQVDIPLPGVSQAINSALPQGEEQLRIDPLEAPASIAFLVWTLGVRAMGIYGIVSYILLRRRLVGAARLRENIYVADRIETPFVTGIFRPRIYLPSGLAESEIELIILHERHHILRGDHIIKLLAFIALALHWFNPLVWLAFLLSSKDMELSCDEAVTGDMDADKRADYSRTLLALATGRRIIAGTPLAFGEGKVTGRIKALLNYKKPTSQIIAIALLVILVAAVTLLTNPKEAARLSIEPGVYSGGRMIYSSTGQDAGALEFKYCVDQSGEQLFRQVGGEWIYMGRLENYDMGSSEFDGYTAAKNGWLENMGRISQCLQLMCKDDSFTLLLQSDEGKSYVAVGWEDLGERGQKGSDDTCIGGIWELEYIDEQAQTKLPDSIANPKTSLRMNAWVKNVADFNASIEVFDRLADNKRLMYSGDGQNRLLTVAIGSEGDLDFLLQLLTADKVELSQLSDASSLFSQSRELLDDYALLLCLVPGREPYGGYAVFEPYAEKGTLVVPLSRMGQGNAPAGCCQLILIAVDRNDFEACHSYDVVVLD